MVELLQFVLHKIIIFNLKNNSYIKMSGIYTYSNASDFGGNLYSDQLQATIQANTNITIPILCINTSGDVVNIIFASNLGSELTYLTAIISAYVPKHVPELSGPYVIPGTNLINYQMDSVPFLYLGNQSNEIHISTETQGQYSSILSAIAANNNANTIFIVHPGTYTENNPISLPTGCSLRSMGHAENTFVIAQNPTQVLINLGLKTEIRGMTLQGTTGATCIYLDGTLSGGQGKFSAVMECFIKNCNIALESDGKTGSGAIDTLYLSEVVIEPLTMSLDKGVYCHSSGLVIGSGVSIAGIPGYFTIADAIFCSDEYSKVALATTSIWYCTNGLTLDNNADSEFALLTCKNNNIGVLIGPNGTTTRLSVNSLQVDYSTTYDISITATNATIQLHSGSLADFMINNPNDVAVNAKYHIVRYGQTYQSMTGDVLFGSISIPTRTYLGEGYFNIDGVAILSNSNLEVGTWVNNTSSALTAVPTSFNMFSGTTAGNCLYIGSSKNIPGVEIDIITATTTIVNLYDIVWEYWDGTSWDPINIMQTDCVQPLAGIASNFVSSVGFFHIRFGITTATNMALKTVSGVSAYWVRFRIVNPISNIPVVQFIKVHPNSLSINTDGTTEYFGNCRPIKELPISLLSSTNADTTPSNQSLYLSSDMSIDYTQNMFATGVFTKIGLLAQIPREFDVSFPLKLSLLFIGDSATSGNVAWTIRWSYIAPGSNVYHLSASAPTSAVNESNVAQSTTISSIDTVTQQTVSLYMNNLTVNPTTDTINLCWITIERSATDTYPGNVSLIDIKGRYISWCSGGHILLF
jgi:hypothetical protein